MALTLYTIFTLALALVLCLCVRALCRKVRRFDAVRSRWLRLEIMRLRPANDADWCFRLWPLALMRACFWRWDIRMMMFPSTAQTRLQAEVKRLGAALAHLQFEHNGLGGVLDDVAARVESNALAVESVLDHDARVLDHLTAVLSMHCEKTGQRFLLPYRLVLPDAISKN